MSKLAGRGRYATETYPMRPPGSSGGAISPLHLYYFVDPLTTATDRNGSVSAPFLTKQEAIDAAVGREEFSFTLVLTSPDTSGAVLPDGVGITVFGTGGSAGSFELGDSCSLLLQNAYAAVSMTDPADQAQLGIWLDQFTAGTVQDVINNINMPAGQVVLSGCGIYGPVIAQSLQLLNCSLGGAGTPSIQATDFNAINSYFTSAIAIALTNGTFKSCEFLAVATVTNVNPIQLDTYSDARFTAAGSSVTGGKTVVG